MSLRIVNLAAEKSPKAKESNTRDWVSYGDDDNYFEYLIDRYNGSAVNNAIISSVSDQIYGEGLSCTDSNKKPLDHAKMMTIFRADDLKKVAHDLKLLGQGAFNIVWNKGRTQILKAKHIPMQNLRPEKAIEGEIKAYYYSDDWSQYRKERYAPRRIEAFTGAKGEETQIMVIKPYASGYFYFSPVDYAGALQWAEIDEEIGTYHLTNIQNGFAPTMMINFNNGQPTEDEQNHIERKVTQKLEGAKGKKWLISFNDDTTNATTIESLPISEASEQYKFLSEEATRKILIGHKVTSPILFGIKDNTGLGNNAEEIKTASQLWDNTVIRPYQNMILDAINEVLAVNGIVLDTYFKTLQPIEFVDTDGLDADEIEKETGVDQEDVVGIEPDTEVVEEDIEKVDASYNGAQISSAIDIVAKVKEGILNEAQAIVFLVQFLQLPEEVARGFFSGGTEQLLSKIALSKENAKKKKSNTFKTLDDIDTTPTNEMMQEAELGLKLRKEYGRGGLEVGVARARDISNGKNLSIETIKRMYSFFSRHEKATKGGQGYNRGDEGYPSAGKIAWLLWGGDAGFSWASRKVKEIEAVEEDFKKCKKKKCSGGKCSCQNYSKEDEKNDIIVANALIDLGEELNLDEWEVIEDVDAETHEELEAYKFASTGVARPNSKSEQDATIGGYMYKVRYEYYPKKVSKNSREFCRKMVAADKLYRKEDIIAMGDKSVNAGWGLNGADTYSIWEFKGGGGCHHKWRRKTFRSLTKIDTKSPLAPTVSTNEADRQGYRVRNPRNVAIKPKDMPNKGFVNKK